MKVKEVMSREVAAVPASATLAQAAATMWEKDCGVLPVTGPEGGQLQGILTDRDICMAALSQGRPLLDIPVGLPMSRDVSSCRPEQDVKTAEQVMRDHQLRRLPVVDADQHVVGMLSLGDLACAAARARGQANRVRKQEVAETLGAISQHTNGEVRTEEAPGEAEA